MPPIGAARAISIACQRSAQFGMGGEQLCLHLQRHGIGDSRPPVFNAATAAARTPSSLPPPPMKMASGSGRSEALAAPPFDDGRPGTPKAARCARCAQGPLGRLLDGDCAQGRDRTASIRCLSSRSRRRYPTSSSPWRGASAESVSARISCLVIWPSCSNSPSSSPGQRQARERPSPATTSMAQTFSGSISVSSNASARQLRTAPVAAERLENLHLRLHRSPLDVSSAASCAGVCASDVSAMMRRP
jgi:hypothetical protein